MKKIIPYVLILLGLLTIAMAFVPSGPPKDGCIDCHQGCMYGLAENGEVMTDWTDCPQDCFCEEIIPIGGNPTDGVFDGNLYWEGWCYEPEPDIPEFTFVGAGLILLGAGLFIHRRKG